MKMKSQTKQLLIFLAVLIAVLAVYLGLRGNNNPEKPNEDEFLSKILVHWEGLTEVTYTDEGGDPLTFIKNEYGWVNADEPDLALEQDMLDDIEDAFCSLSYQRVLETPEALSVYGLDPAIRSVSGTSSEGESKTILLGNQVGYDDIYYAREVDSNTVYVISGDLFTSTDFSLLQFAVLETFPVLSESNIKSISLTTPAATLQLNKLTERSQEVQADTGETVITEHYRWSLSNGTRISNDNATLTAVLEELAALSFDSAAAYRASEYTYTSFAFDVTLTVACVDGTEMALQIGAPDSNDSFRFARLDYSDLIHWISASSVDSLLTMTTESLLSAS